MQKTGILLAVLALVIASTFDLLAGTLVVERSCSTAWDCARSLW
jgi:hypothetical protein